MGLGDALTSGGEGAAGGSFLGPIGTIIGGITGFVSGLFGGGGWKDALSNFASTVAATFDRIWRVIKALGNFLGEMLHHIGGFITHLWTGFFRGVFTDIWKALTRAHAFLESKLAPVVRFLKRAKAFYDRIFKLYIKPQLEMMQRIRRYLGVLRLAHIHVADGLDRRLASQERLIGGLFAETRGYLNGIIDVVNLIAEPTRLDRMVIRATAGARTISALLHIGTGRPLGFWAPSPRRSAPAWAKPTARTSGFVSETYNPPASALLGEPDPLVASGFLASSPVPDDAEIDDLDVLDYFDDGLYPVPECTDPAACMEQAYQRELQGVTGARSSA